VLFPDATNAETILGILLGGGVAAVIMALVIMALSQNGGRSRAEVVEASEPAVGRNAWRMPPLDNLPPAKLSLAAKSGMGILRIYLVVAGGLVLARIVSLAIGHG
jgi:hypothetical protein